MHEVKRAIIMAAGLGNRMLPVTAVVPKPLVEVNGRRMIDTIIQGLLYNGIREIHVVVGYQKEQFQTLKREYPEIHFIDNPYYQESNNISSLYVARNYLEDVMILDGDQMICQKAILGRFFERSGYNCIWTPDRTDEWLLTLEGDIVTHCSRTGGSEGWQLFSISRWTKRDGEKLRRHLEYEFEKKRNWQIYWDDVALFCYPDEYQLGIWEMQPGDVVEIDSLEELAEIDHRYQMHLNKESKENR